LPSSSIVKRETSKEGSLDSRPMLRFPLLLTEVIKFAPLFRITVFVSQFLFETILTGIKRNCFLAVYPKKFTAQHSPFKFG